jgi:hypothetical protein
MVTVTHATDVFIYPPISTNWPGAGYRFARLDLAAASAIDVTNINPKITNIMKLVRRISVFTFSPWTSFDKLEVQKAGRIFRWRVICRDDRREAPATMTTCVNWSSSNTASASAVLVRRSVSLVAASPTHPSVGMSSCG